LTNNLYIWSHIQIEAYFYTISHANGQLRTLGMQY